MLPLPTALRSPPLSTKVALQISGSSCPLHTYHTHQNQRQAIFGLPKSDTQVCSASAARMAQLLVTEPQQSPGRRHALSGLFVTFFLGCIPQQATAGLIDEQQADKVFESASQSVVSIADYKVDRGDETSEGTGSGFFWDSYGHVVTNYHCVAKFATDRLGAQVMLDFVVPATWRQCICSFTAGAVYAHLGRPDSSAMQHVGE